MEKRVHKFSFRGKRISVIASKISSSRKTGRRKLPAEAVVGESQRWRSGAHLQHPYFSSCLLSGEYPVKL